MKRIKIQIKKIIAMSLDVYKERMAQDLDVLREKEEHQDRIIKNILKESYVWRDRI